MEPLTTKEFIDIASKSFTLNHRACVVCKHLPLEKVCEVTLDILFDRRSIADMQRYYTQFAPQRVSEGKVLGEHNFRHHRKKCCKDKAVFTEEDLRKLGLLQDEAEMLQRLYNLKYDDVINPITMREELHRQRINNLSKLEKQRREAENNVVLLDQGILPKVLEGIYQLKSGSVDSLNSIRRQENDVVVKLTRQIDVIQSDIQKNASTAEKASKSNTTVIQVMNSSLTDMEIKFSRMMKNFHASLNILLPNQPDVVQHIFSVLRNCMNADIVPVIEKTKEVLQIESK